MPVRTPPTPPPSLPAPEIEAGVIEDARARQRRHRRIGWALAAAVALAAGALIAGLAGGSGTGRHANGQPSSPDSSASDVTIVPKRPVAIAVGSNGELYVADAGREQILRRLPNGRFAAAAGTGAAGDTGDGGRATQAELDHPGALAVAPNGAVYFVQTARPMRSVVREVEPNGTISTVAGRDPNCSAVPTGSRSVPAQAAAFSGASLAIGSDGQLAVSTAVCPNVLRLDGVLRLTPSGKLVQTATDARSDPRGFCSGGVAGSGFVVFGCVSGAGRGPRLMIVRSNGAVENYPDAGSQPNDMAAAGGTVVAIHNGAVVRVGAHGLETIATRQQLAGLVSGTALRMGDNGIAIDARGTVYVNQDFLVGHRGCTDVIAEIDPNGRMHTLWRSAPTGLCY